MKANANEIRVMLGILFLSFFTSIQLLCTTDPQFASVGVQIVRSSEAELVLDYTPQVSGFDTVFVKGLQTLTPRIAGASPIGSIIGAPLTVELVVPVTVPSPEAFHIDNISVQSVRSIQQRMTPKKSFSSQITEIDENVYALSAQTDWATVNYVGIARDRHLANIRFIAAQFDGLSNSIQIPTKIRITISFKPQDNISFSTLDSYDISASINQNQTNRFRIAIPQTSSVGKHPEQLLSSGTWLKIEIESEGMYKIDASQLVVAGINISTADVPTLKIFGNSGADMDKTVSAASNNIMNEQPLIVRTTETGALSSIIFYASGANGFAYNNGNFQHYINHFSAKNYYILTFGGVPGLRATAIAPPAELPISSPSTFTSRLFWEQEVTNPYSPGSGQRWFATPMEKNYPVTYPTFLSGLTAGDIFYRISVAHSASTQGQFVVTETDNALMTLPLYAVNGDYDAAYAITQTGVLQANSVRNSQSVLKFVYQNSTGSLSASGYIDYFEIHYPRTFNASGGELEFFSDPATNGVTQYTANGFSSEIFGFDVTDRAHPKLLANQANTGGIFSFKTVLSQNFPTRFFLSSNLKTPTLLQTDVANLHTDFPAVDAIVVTDKDLLTSANEFKTYRESQNELSVGVVTTEQIYNEFNGGTQDPGAIRDFLAYMYTKYNHKLKYVILWGDGHFDYKGIATKQRNYVPAFENLDGDGTLNAVGSTLISEDFYAKIAGNDDRIDVGIGRITAGSPADAEIILKKIKHYETQSSPDNWRTETTLVADDSWSGLDSRGNIQYNNDMHTNQSEDLSNKYLPADIRQRKIYEAEYPTENIPGGRRKPRVMQDIISAANSGTLLLSWVGHGNPHVWAHEDVFENSLTIPLMTNIDKLFFLSAATCDFGRFDDPDRQCGAEELLSSPIGGAIAVFSADRAVYGSLNEQICNEFYSHLFSKSNGKYLRLGDVIFLTKQTTFNSENDQKFYLLGDPTMRLLIPDKSVRITSLNGSQIPPQTQDTLQLNALSKVTVEGFVSQTGDSTIVDNAFNGTITLNLFDSDIKKIVPDEGLNSNIYHKYWVLGGSLNMTTDSVKNGRFSTSFTLPKDISFFNEHGRLFAFASGNTGYAKGATRDFTVGGVDTNVTNDGNGPDIEIYADTRTFRAGDFVQPIPLLIVDLSDQTGINATGLGIGHGIQAWIDGSPNPIDLTKSVTSSKGKILTVQKELFGLSPGNHTIRIRAWDVFNNYSESQTYFRIASTEAGLILDDVFNYPNPFSLSTTFAFRHNQLNPIQTTVEIFTIDGRLVRTLANVIVSRSAEVVWDGKDSSGYAVESGLYFYRVHIQTTDDSGSRDAFGKLSLRR